MSREAHIPVWGRIRVLAVMAVLVTAGILGSRWLSRVAVTEVVVIGTRMSDADAVRDLAGVAEGHRLIDVKSSLVADRAAREPWVAAAAVRRLPGGRVTIRVQEHLPVALQLDRSGEPVYYLAADGARMPFRAGSAWNVPLIRGLTEPYHPMARLSEAPLAELLQTLADLSPDLDALTSEWHLDRGGELTLITVRPPDGEAFAVRMGDTQFEERLRRFRSFWDQAVLPRPGVQFDWVDLRFEDQIVTKETA